MAGEVAGSLCAIDIGVAAAAAFGFQRRKEVSHFRHQHSSRMVHNPSVELLGPIEARLQPCSFPYGENEDQREHVDVGIGSQDHWQYLPSRVLKARGILGESR